LGTTLKHHNELSTIQVNDNPKGGDEGKGIDISKSRNAELLQQRMCVNKATFFDITIDIQ